MPTNTSTPAEPISQRFQCDEPLAYLIVRDPEERIVAEGIGSVEVKNLPGIYSLEIRVPGEQRGEFISLSTSSLEPLHIPSPPWHSAIPAADNPDAEALWQTEEGFAKTMQRKRRVPWGYGRIVLCVWSPDSKIETVPAYEVRTSQKFLGLSWKKKLAFKNYQGKGYLISEKILPPQTYEVSFSIPHLGRRVQVLPVMAGWTTRVFVRVIASEGQEAYLDFSSTVITLERKRSAFAESRFAFYRTTEVALDALYFGHIGVSKEQEKILLKENKIDEPILAMAVAYAHLKRIEETDRRRSNVSENDPKREEILTQVAKLGQELARRLPNSTDARIIAVAALWLKHRDLARDDWEVPAILHNTSAGVLVSATAKTLNLPRLFARLTKSTRTALVPFVIALFCLLVALWQSHRAGGTGGNDNNGIVIVAIFVLVLSLGYGVYGLWKPSILVKEPPLFADGMDFLLRLSALYEPTCPSRGSIVDAALRLTSDCLWTRWTGDVSPQEAHNRLQQMLKDLEASLQAKKEKGEESTTITALSDSEVREKAIQHLAFSWRLPARYLRRFFRKANRGTYAGILSQSRESLSDYYRKETEASRKSATRVAPTRVPATSLSDLLIALGIIAILAAILFPVFAQARASARKTSDLSNIKQIGMSAQMYIQDYDETLPSPAFRTCGGPPVTMPPNLWSRNWRTWPELVYPYTKNMDIFTSPERRDSIFYGYGINVNSSNDDFPSGYDPGAKTGGGTPPGNWNEGKCTVAGGVGVPRPEQSAVTLAQAQAPATTIWFYDSNSSIYQAGLNVWADMENLVATNPDAAAAAKSLEIDGSETIGQLFLTGGSNVDKSALIREPHRYSQGVNISWMDGHSKWLKPSAIKGDWWSLEQVPQGVE